MSDGDHADAIAKYDALISGFVSGDVSAPDFKRSYLAMFKSETHHFGGDLYRTLQKLFEDADDYVVDDRLRTDPGDLDAEQLSARAETALGSIRRLDHG